MCPVAAVIQVAGSHRVVGLMTAEAADALGLREAGCVVNASTEIVEVPSAEEARS
jgi:hypothetical protein